MEVRKIPRTTRNAENAIERFLVPPFGRNDVDLIDEVVLKSLLVVAVAIAAALDNTR